MNEPPGVRPVVVQPSTPQNAPVRPLASNAKVMPVGLSANSLGVGDGSVLTLRRLLFIGVPVVIVLAVLLGTWLFVRSLAPLASRTLTNSAFEYNLLFYKQSETINLVAGEGLQYEDKALLIAKPTSDDVVDSCDQIGKGWQEAMRVKVEGIEHPVCRLNSNVFLTTFYHGNTRHMVEITYTSPHAVNTSDVRQVMQSVKVALP